MKLAFAALLLICTWPGALAAQDRTGAAQIPQAEESAIAPSQPAPSADEPVAQISNDDESGPDQAQLTAAATSAQQPSQVATRTKNPQAPDPLSTPEQGRTAAIEPVSGSDSCDPTDGKDKNTLKCKRVIENRSAEYRRVTPPQLSPEQKLMIDQKLRSEQGASQRLAQSGEPEDDLDSMGIASVVLNQQNGQDESEKKKDEQDQQSQAAIQALITVLQSNPSPN